MRTLHVQYGIQCSPRDREYLTPAHVWICSAHVRIVGRPSKIYLVCRWRLAGQIGWTNLVMLGLEIGWFPASMHCMYNDVATIKSMLQCIYLIGMSTSNCTLCLPSVSTELASSPGLQLCGGKAWYRLHAHAQAFCKICRIRICTDIVGLYVYGQFYGKVYGKSSACACSRYQAFPPHNYN